MFGISLSLKIKEYMFGISHNKKVRITSFFFNQRVHVKVKKKNT